MMAETHQAMKILTIKSPTQLCIAPKAVRLLILALQIGAFLVPASAQTVIGGVIPDPTAILDLQSADRGLLLPRLTQAQRDAIQSPAMGLMIFNTTSVCLEINFGTPSAPMWWPYTCRGSIGALNCAGAVSNSNLTAGFPATTSRSIPYTGGNGGPHPGHTVNSTGVTGLTATLPAGNFANGVGTLVYNITGTPSGAGTASFALDIGGQACMLSVTVVTCGAYVAPSQWKVFMCHNLAAANTSADPLTPSWEVNGGYWQWGRLGPSSSQWLNTNTPNFAHGPTGSGAFEANSGSISGWSTAAAPDGAWPANNPCPQGFTVPTKGQWDGVLNNNNQNITGTWDSSPTNYGSGRFFGPGLMLPAAGGRFNYGSGELFSRGDYGYYWSRSEGGTDIAWQLSFFSGGANTTQSLRRDGLSLRCVASDIGSLNCSGTVITGTSVCGQAVSGVSVSLPYTGGNGVAYAMQSVSSTGATGLTATLPAGNFANGGGSLVYIITGTPASAGTASFALSIGGQGCTLSVTVGEPAVGAISSLNCSGAEITGVLTSGQAALGVGVSAYYAGGNCGPHPGQIVTSTGVTGLTATLPAGNFDSGGGSLTYNITGTPVSFGTASFALNIGGQACILSVTVVLPPGGISSLNCGGAVIAGTLTCSQVSSGVSASVPYMYGNGGVYSMQSVSSTGVTGLTATLVAGVLANGGGNLLYTITGTPASAGTASFALSIGEQACTLSVTVGQPAVGAISSLNCGAGITSFLYQAASGVRAILYTGGNCGSHPGQTVTSTGVTGLTATLPAGNFASGDGSLTYTITGTPASLGTASFAMDIGGQACTLSLTVVTCGAYVASNQWKTFMCHNLAAANTSADPFTPSWEINGGYWQWGRLGPGSSQWLYTNTPNFAHGPTGSGTGQTNELAISGWDEANAPDSAWLNATKTVNDPCPQGFRVPTQSQWAGVQFYNTPSITGTWTSSATNYSSGRFFGPGLMLPAAGNRYFLGGQLFSRGGSGSYWSSTEVETHAARFLRFDSGGAYTTYDFREYGFSLRCIAE
ncbi:MAG: hypothetical protein RI973_591 [Bacteroidota bacterium]|jgi:uncharacterized protein (TIGR02145 family)